MGTLDMRLCQRGWSGFAGHPGVFGTFPDVCGSSDSQLEPCLDRLGIGRLDWRLPSMPYVQTLTMRYVSI